MYNLRESATSMLTQFYHSQRFTPLIFIVFLFACNEKQPVQQTELQTLPVVTVHPDTVTTFKEYPASAEGAINVEVRPQVDGKLQSVLVDEGAFVNKGQLLFQIDDRPFQARVSNAKASLRAAQGALTNTKLELEKLTPLVQNKVISAYQLKTAGAAKETAEGNVEQARANVNTALLDLEYTRVTAPVSGYIGRLSKKQGSNVSANDEMPLTLLSDIHEVHIYFSLSETDFINFKRQNAGSTMNDKLKKMPSVSLVLADQSIYELPGRIDMVDGQFDKNTGAVTLRATFPNPDRILRSGNTGKVRLNLLHHDVSLIPQAATVEMQDKIFVFLVGDSNKVYKQLIKIAGKSGTNYVVADVKTGSKLITSGIDHITEGEKIKIK